MPLEAQGLIGLALALALAYTATPVAIRMAARLEFYDRPVGYKGHGRPTPYLGGAAVIAAFVVAVMALTGDSSRTLPLIGGVLLLWAVGTLDDRRTVTPTIRVGIEVALASLLWAMGHGWQIGLGDPFDWAISVLWIVAVVNAFNLFDNMDGAAGSMAAVVAGAVAVLGVVEGNVWLSVTAAALCGACIGFLPYNLASPARIFLGDGGSMPVGFAVAALVMIGAADAALEWQALAMGLLLVGVPALDTALVIVSRKRRRISILTGGRDHLTHRARTRLQTARAVALTLGSVQATISALAIVAIQGGSAVTVVAVAVYLVGIGVAIALLDTRMAPVPGGAHGPAPLPVGATRRPLSEVVPLVVVVPLGLALGLSPLASGYYDSAIWVPGGLALASVTTAAVIAHPPRLTRRAWVSLLGLAGMGLLAIASALWADSIEQAFVDGNRLIVLAMLLGAILTFVRSDRAALWVLGAIGVAVTAVAAVVVVRLLGADPGALLISGRLNEPLGYINGQGGFFLLGFWICVAAAEQKRSVAVAAAAIGVATLLASLMILTQSRGAAIAAIASAVVVLALVPGRLRRAWTLIVIGSSVLLASPYLLDVYEDGQVGILDPSTGHRAALAALGVAALAAAGWAAVLMLAGRERLARPLRAAAIGILAVAVVAVSGIAVVSRDAIGSRLDAQYSAFVKLGEPASTGPAASTTSRLASAGGNRYDYWRIAWNTFRENPVLGVGAGNYDGPYFASRATTEDVRQPHSIQLQTLSELGLLGGALLALLLSGLVAGAWRLSRAARSAPVAGLLAVAGVGIATSWLVQTTVDWIHLLPGVTGIALVAATLLLRPAPNEAMPSLPGDPRALLMRRAVPSVAVGLVLVVAALSLSRQGLAEHFRANAQDKLATDPEGALVEADRALRLDHESMGAYYVKAAALARFGRADAARASLTEAARREPRDFVTWALLGDLSVREGRFDAARSFYARASALNPRDAGLQALAKDPRLALESATSG